MPFADYTSPQEVRSLLGASAKEVTDGVVTTNTYLTMMLEKLDEIDPTTSAVYLAARDAEPPTKAQARFVLLVQTFCAYVVAIGLVPAIPNLIAKRITDGKSEVERNNPYASLMPELLANLSWIRQRVVLALAELNGQPAPTAVTRRLAGGIPLGLDPVAG